MNEQSACAVKLWKGEPELSEKSSSLYGYMFEHAPIGIVHFNKNGEITSCNKKFVDILGCRSHAKTGQKLRTFFGNLNVGKALSKALNGEIGVFKGEFKTAESEKWIAIRAEFHPVQDHDGMETGVAMVQDISKEYYAEKKVEESKERYDTIFSQNHHVILLIDVETGYIKNANSAALKFYGWDADQMKSMRISEINMLSANQVKREMEKARSRKSSSYHLKHRLADGSVRDVEVYSGLVKVDEELCFYSIIHDITDRINYHQELMKFKLGIERSSNIIIITDREGRIEYVNPSFTREYGYTLTEVKGKTPRVLKSGEHGINFYKKFWDTISNGHEMQGELINKTKDGRLLNISFSSNPIINDDGYTIGYIAIQENITERMKKDRALRESLEEKKLLLSEIHHRVKNNMAIISGLLELNLYQGARESVEDFIRNSQQRIKAMANVHELLYQSETFSTVPFKDYVGDLIEHITSGVHNTRADIQIDVEVDDIELNINQAIPCGLIMNEVILHAIMCGLKDQSEPRINIKLKDEDAVIALTIQHNGNDAKKGHLLQEEQSYGITLINILSKQLNAEYTTEANTQGTKTRIVFPLIKQMKGSSSALLK